MILSCTVYLHIWQRLRQALEALFADLDVLIEARAAFLKRQVDFPEAGLYSLKTREAIARGAETGRPFAAMALGVAEAKEHIKLIRISGLSPQRASDWAHVRRFVELHELPRTAEAVFERVPVRELMGSAAQLASVHEQLKRHLTRADLAQALTLLANMQEQLAGTSGPVSNQLRLFIEAQLGNPDLSSERVAAHYAEIAVELRRIGALAGELALIREVRQRLAEAGAHKLAHRIGAVAVRSSGEDQVFPATWREAWNWARMRRHLDNIESREELITLAERRREIELGLARRYINVMAKAAWLSTKRNASPKLLQALSGYATAIRRIGQGTGPNATRAMVVGDHKQVSRDAGFIAAQRIQELKHHRVFQPSALRWPDPTHPHPEYLRADRPAAGDLVVEGSGDSRLAVECDGDEFHGYDRWQHDTTRQRVLERAGWTFWRCFASTWILRKDEVFAELLERLTALGIEPIGAIDRAPGLVEKRTWRPPEVVVTAVTPSVQQIADAGEEGVQPVAP